MAKAPPGSLRAHIDRMGDLLHCPICGDWLTHPVAFVGCSHTYCSICIRRALSFKLECPTCRKDVTPGDLFPTRLIAELVATYAQMSSALDQLAAHAITDGARMGQATQDAAADRPAAVADVPTVVALQQHTSLAPSQLTQFTQAPQLPAPSMTAEPKPLVSSPIKRALEKPLPPVAALAKVSCPVCSLQVAEDFINAHLDSCLGGGDVARDKFHQREAVRMPKPATTLPPMPGSKVVYRLWTDAKLRREVKALGLSTKGKRDDLIRRHREYTLQYRAEQDALEPRTAEQIARDVEEMTTTMAAEVPQAEEVTEKHPGFTPLLTDVMLRKRSRGSAASQMSQLDDSVIVLDDTPKKADDPPPRSAPPVEAPRALKSPAKPAAALADRRVAARTESDVELVTPPERFDLAAEMRAIMDEERTDHSQSHAYAARTSRASHPPPLPSALKQQGAASGAKGRVRIRNIVASQASQPDAEEAAEAADEQADDEEEAADTDSSLRIWSRTQNRFGSRNPFPSHAPTLPGAVSDPPSSPHLSPAASQHIAPSQMDIVQSSPFALAPARADRQLAAKAGVVMK